MFLSPLDLLWLTGIGLLAGMCGGLLGVGGSIIMIPGLAILLGRANPESQHLHQAAAMAVNVFVALPAALRHRAAGVVRSDVLRWLLPSAVVAILLGAALSNLAPGIALRRAFAVCLGVIAVSQSIRAARPRAHGEGGPERITPARCISIGATMGLAGGLLGIGGGVIAVPMLLLLCRLPLRQAIGASSAVMCISAAVGATLKIATLDQHGFSPASALVLAAALGPGAFAGGAIGASLTHRLPLRVVRLAFALLLFVAAWNMADLRIR